MKQAGSKRHYGIYYCKGSSFNVNVFKGMENESRQNQFGKARHESTKFTWQSKDKCLLEYLY